MRRAIAGAAALLIAALPAAAAATDPSGRWAIHAGGRTLALITVTPDSSVPGRWWVDLDRPTGTAFTQGHMAVGMTSAREHLQLRSLPVGPDVTDRIGGPAWGQTLALKYADPTPDRAKDVILFTTMDANHAAWGLKNAPLEPILLVRARPGETVDRGWEAGHDYPIDEPWPNNAEMARLFDDDQAARNIPHIDWDVVAPQDAARRVRTRALLDTGALHSADDFWRAAFLFQHGDRPEDYLLAHGLAIIAAAKGRRDATWIAAATLDRYLQSIGQKQVYGTQYRTRPGVPATQEPYDRTTISDAMRMATGVPTQAWQEKQRAEFDRQSAAAAPKP